MKKSQGSSVSLGGRYVTRSSPSPECTSSSNSRSRANNSNYSCSDSSQLDSPFYIKRVQRKIKQSGRTISSNSSSNVYGAASSDLTGIAGSCLSSQPSSASKRPGLNVSENNSIPGSGSRCSKKDACGSEAIYGAKVRPVRPKAGPGGKAAAAAAALGGKSPDAVVQLMSACTSAAAKQAERLRRADGKGGDCLRENPYASFGTDTFRRLLARTGGRRLLARTGGRLLARTGGRRRRMRAGGSGRKRPKIKWCRPKVDECETMQTQLCPNLGAGHTHGKLLEEVTPLLLRATQSVNCQLRELCRRLFFMRHNVPQLTAPALVNFHGILAEIARMLMADFSSFPTGLKLPDRSSAA